jgi:hypothetical protein
VTLWSMNQSSHRVGKVVVTQRDWEDGHGPDSEGRTQCLFG